MSGIEYRHTWTETGTDGQGTLVEIKGGVTKQGLVGLEVDDGKPVVMDVGLAWRVLAKFRADVESAQRGQIPPDWR